MSTVVTRSEVQQRLEAWRAGRLSAEGIHDWAEARYAISGYEPEDAAVKEVLAKLDTLDMNLLISDDVPALLEVLGARTESLAEALVAFDSYWSRLDIPQRRAILRADKLYAPFCGAG